MPLLLQLLLVGGVLFGIAVVATGRGEALVEVPPDAADPGLPPTGPLSGHDVRTVRFGLAFRGYRMAEVDAVLGRLAEELDVRDRALRDLASGDITVDGLEDSWDDDQGDEYDEDEGELAPRARRPSPYDVLRQERDQP